MSVRLTTPRLLLRDFEPEDWVAVQEYAADPEAVRFRPFGPCTDEETREHVLELSRQILDSPRRVYDLALVRIADGKLIGGCDVGWLAQDRTEGAIGYGLSPAHWGCGYATETVSALLRFGFEELHVNRISAGVDVENHASIRVLEKSGLRRVGLGEQRIKGELRPLYQYLVTVVEWRGSNQRNSGSELISPP